VPIVVENDADCAALAEGTYGAGKHSALFVYYGLGTGVGSGVIDNGRIFHGAFDPEFGHQIVEPRLDRYCTAGHRGCLESLISGGALECAFGSIDDVPDEQWNEVIPHYLGQALANATLFLSPDRIVIGGGVVDHRPDIVPPAIRVMEEMLHGFMVPPGVATSQFGREVGILGAAAAAWQLRQRVLYSQ
jgi:fructokinase